MNLLQLRLVQRLLLSLQTKLQQKLTKLLHRLHDVDVRAPDDGTLLPLQYAHTTTAVGPRGSRRIPRRAAPPSPPSPFLVAVIVTPSAAGAAAPSIVPIRTAPTAPLRRRMGAWGVRQRPRRADGARLGKRGGALGRCAAAGGGAPPTAECGEFGGSAAEVAAGKRDGVSLRQGRLKSRVSSSQKGTERRIERWRKIESKGHGGRIKGEPSRCNGCYDMILLLVL